MIKMQEEINSMNKVSCRNEHPWRSRSKNSIKKESSFKCKLF